MQALTGNLGFTRLLLKGLELTQQGTPICQQQHLFLCSQMVSSPEENPGDMWEGKKNAKSIVTASGYPPNQIEKKTKEIFWLLYSFCIPLWNRWIFFLILPIFKCLQRNCPVRRGKFREGSNTFLNLSGSSFLIRLPTSHFDFYW